MEWTDIIIETGRPQADTAAAVATAFGSGGLYIEDYSDLEQHVLAITHMDLIEQELLDKPKDRVRIHLYVSPDENPARLAVQLGVHLLAAGAAHTPTPARVHPDGG